MSSCFRLTERDKKLLAFMYCHRLVLARQLVELGFFGSLVRCNSRLRKLREAGLTTKAFVPSIHGIESIHRVTAKASQVIAEVTGLDPEEVKRAAKKGFSLMQLEHCVKVTNLRIQIEKEADKRKLDCHWIPEALCRHEYSVKRLGHWQKRILKPDGLLLLETGPAKSFYFIEVDLGCVSHSKFKAKVRSYEQYGAGVFQQTYSEEAFTVLVVTTGQKRLERLKRLTQEATPEFLFTTFSSLESHSPLDEVWKSSKQGGFHCICKEVLK